VRVEFVKNIYSSRFGQRF